MCSAHRLMVFPIFVKFHENMSSNFKLMEQTQKLLNIEGNNSKSRKTRVMVHMFYRLMVFKICVNFHKYVKRF